MGDENENERLGPPWVLFTDDGAPVAILPAGRPGQVARILATSLEDAARIVAITNAMRAQRDEARELVRGAAEAGAWDADIHEMRQAVARWDEEEKKR